MSSRSTTITLDAHHITADHFWHSIEKAWQDAKDGGAHERLVKTSGKRRNDAFIISRHKLPWMLWLLGDYMYTFTSAQLYSWRGHFQQALEAIWPLTVPSIDSTKFDDQKLWLTHCAFAITAGREYYEAFRASPKAYMLPGVKNLMAFIVILPVFVHKWVVMRENKQSECNKLSGYNPDLIQPRHDRRRVRR